MQINAYSHSIRIAGWMLVIYLLTLSACIDVYLPELDKYTGLLVIEGKITNQPGPYTVKLSTSVPVSNEKPIPMSGATVTISDDQGVSEELKEEGTGVYKTSPTGIRGEVGRSYQLTIITSEGKTYRSEPAVLQDNVPVKQVSERVEFQYDRDKDYDPGGYQFYLDVDVPDSRNRFFLWRLFETYEYHAEFLLAYTYSGRFEPYPNPGEFRVCWRTEVVDEIFTLNTASRASSTISQYPLHFVDTDTKKLSVRYSLLTEQYTIDQQAFLFWDGIKNQQIEDGALYTKQPYQIRGNVRNEANPEEPVLGYFLVAGLSSKRIFVDPPPVEFHLIPCIIDGEGLGDLLRFPDPSIWPIWVAEGVNGNRGISQRGCIDCRELGGVLVKPSFW